MARRAGDDKPTLNLSCDIIFSAGQRPTEVVGPLLEDEAAALQADFSKAGDAPSLLGIDGAGVEPLVINQE